MYFTVPKQKNNFDCGMYTCQFAFAMYQFRDYLFYYDRLYTEEPRLKDIVQSAAFAFTGKDTAKLRKNMGTLLDNLSTLYLATLSENKPTEPMRIAAYVATIPAQFVSNVTDATTLPT